MSGVPQQCPVCAGTPTVLVAVRHPALRSLTVELLEREHGCWRVQALAVPSDLARALTIAPPDLVVVDTPDFPRCCREALDGFPPDRVIVVGPEPDPAYEGAARRAGAGAWLARDRVAEDLSAGMRAALGCSHSRCPDQHGDSLNERRRDAVSSAATVDRNDLLSCYPACVAIRGARSEETSCGCDVVARPQRGAVADPDGVALRRRDDPS